MFIIEGLYEVTVGDETAEAGPGSIVFIPRNVVHRFKNVGGVTGRMLGWSLPGGQDHYLKAISELAAGGGFTSESAGRSIPTSLSSLECPALTQRRLRKSVIQHEDARLGSMGEDELVRELADRADKLGTKIGMSIGEQHPHELGETIVQKDSNEAEFDRMTE